MRKFSQKISVFALLLSLSFTESFAQIAGTSSTLSVTNNTATVVDNALTITSTGSFTDMIVQITDGYLSGASGDILGYTGTLPTGVTATYDNTKGVLKFVGSSAVSNPTWQALLRTVTLKTTSAVCYPEKRTVTFVLGNKYYNPMTGHYYEYYATTANWTVAKAYADGRSYMGKKGYLATITSAAENNFIWKIMNQNSWMGLSDDYSYINAATGVTTYANQVASEGHFFWVTGPEAGTNISNGNGSPSLVAGKYNNWTGGEPNNLGNENYGHLYSGTNGLWNDFANTQNITSVIEYGDMPNDATTNNIGFSSRNIFVSGASSGTITGGGVDVCTGTNSTTLTISGLTGSVVRWEYSYDNFLTAGVSISNTTTSYTATNLTQTTYYRAIVNSTSPNACSNLATSPTTITVSATATGNITAASTTVCTGGSAILTLSGNQGTVLKWQRSTSATFASAVTDISNTTSSLTDPLASNGTYYYRVQVQKNGCGSPAFSSGLTITAGSGTPSVGGNVSNMAYCGGSNSGTLSLTGNTGNITKWQSSVDNGIVWADIVNTTTSLSFSAVTATTLYRAVVQNGSCPTSNSNPGTVEITNTTGTWLGNTSNDWQTASNWCGGIPTSSTNVIIPAGRMNNPSIASGIGYCNNIVINAGAALTIGTSLQVTGTMTQNGTINAASASVTFNGTSAQTIPASAFNSNSIQNLTINNANGVTLGGNLSVSGTLTFTSGLLTTSSSALLTMTSTSNAVVGASSTKYINGPVKKSGTSAFIFPVGKGGKYAPAEMSAPVSSTDFTAEYFNTSYSNLTKSSGLINVSYKEYWNIDRANGTSPINLSLYYYDPAFSGVLNNTSNTATIVAHFNSSGGYWEDLASGTKSVSATKVTMNGVNSFSPFTFGSPTGLNPLPVTLVRFEAVPDNTAKTVELKWQTTTEQNCSYFEVLYSTDLSNWTSIGKVNCFGSANLMNDYTFSHLDPIAKNYYRLNQVDGAGNTFLSDIRSAVFNSDINGETVKIYPNPSSGSITIRQNNATTGNASNYEVSDFTGNIIQTGNFTQSVEIRDLPKGIYMIKIVSEGTVKNEKIIVR